MNNNYDRTAGGFAFFVVDANGPMSQILAQNWWLVALRGLFALIFGGIAVLLPGVTITAMVLLFAAYTACAPREGTNAGAC